MNQDLFKILKELKNIQPDSDYSKQSRFLIIAQARDGAKKESVLGEGKMVGQKVWLTNVLEAFYPGRLALIGGVVVLMIIIGGISYINNQLDQRNLVVKANEMNASIQIKLNEIRYLIENKSQLDPQDVSNIQILLDQAANNLKEVLLLEGKNLEEALEKIRSSQETLEQIDKLIKNK